VHRNIFAVNKPSPGIRLALSIAAPHRKQNGPVGLGLDCCIIHLAPSVQITMFPHQGFIEMSGFKSDGPGPQQAAIGSYGNVLK
jgi:hypothetical protein